MSEVNGVVKKRDRDFSEVLNIYSSLFIFKDWQYVDFSEYHKSQEKLSGRKFDLLLKSGRQLHFCHKL